MTTKVKEIRPITEQGRKTDPECSVCGSVPKGKVSHESIWRRSITSSFPYQVRIETR